MRRQEGPGPEEAQSELEQDGFDFELPADYSPRVTAVVQGFENSGKTAWALSSSILGLTLHMAFDPGWITVEKFRKMGRKIGLKVYSTTIPQEVDANDPVAVSDVMGDRLEEFERDLDKADKMKVKNVVIDDAITFYDFVRLGTIGKLQAKAFEDRGAAKGQVNAKMRSLLYRIENSGCNLILVEKLSEFQNRIYTKGWDDTQYFAPYIIRCDLGYKDPDTTADTAGDEQPNFRATIIKSKVYPRLQGKRYLWKEQDGFAAFCAALVPGFVVPQGTVAVGAPVAASTAALGPASGPTPMKKSGGMLGKKK